MHSSRFISWIASGLLMVCLLVNVVAVIPHHHHHDVICMADDNNHHDADSNQEDVEQTCITHFRAHTQVFQQLNDTPIYTTSISCLLQQIGWCFYVQTCMIQAESQAYFIPPCTTLGPPPFTEKRRGRASPVFC